MVESKDSILYTIGHSNHEIEDFISLLKRHGVTCIADVRSAPYSRYCPQFNKDTLAAALAAAGITYMFMGKELGGRPDDPACYEYSCVDFRRVAEREEFKRGIEHLLADIPKHRIALMCAEKDPLQCHRSILVSRNLKKHNVQIKHILADGSIEEHSEAERRLVGMLKIEPALFESTETVEKAYDQQAEKMCRRAKK
ncbi:MAG: DUF488 domain-containing protein [Phycisphaerae bacterium]|nr:DUF488 domain-containing protein [Phycisphaerae bacterium]MDD5380534.1 DUF488 domain-containing protein [Phycisphaerae bacterium]